MCSKIQRFLWPLRSPVKQCQLSMPITGGGQSVGAAWPVRLCWPRQTRRWTWWANMCLHATHQPQAMLQTLAPPFAGGWFCDVFVPGAGLAQGTEGRVPPAGLAPPCHSFTDMHDWGDMLVQQGFAAPVMDGKPSPPPTLPSSAWCRSCVRWGATCTPAAPPPPVAASGWPTGSAPGQSTGPGHARWPVAPEFRGDSRPRLQARTRVKVAASSAVSLDDMRGMLGASRSARTPR